MTFSELGINEYIIHALQNNKISIPTDIQKQAIPHILNKKQDLVAVAQTGTGKTAAFCLPILQSIDPMLPKIQALVLVPTRELGQQVAREFFLFSKYLPRVFAESVYGGAPIDEQIQNLKRATHVVVATPGRLIDLLERKALSLDDLNFLVLDEADEVILKAAAAHKLTLVTYDCRTIPPLLKVWAESDLHHGGVVLVDAKTIPPSDIGGLVRALEKLGRETSNWHGSDRVIFLRR